MKPVDGRTQLAAAAVALTVVVASRRSREVPGLYEVRGEDALATDALVLQVREWLGRVAGT